MKVTFKYAIGQKVKLASNNFCSCQYSRENRMTDFVGKDVTITNRGFRIELVRGTWRKPNFMDKYYIEKVYYIKEDPVLDKDHVGSDELTRIPESCLNGEDVQDVFVVHFCSSDGHYLSLDEKVYADIVHNYGGERQANTRFSFATYGKITGFMKNWEIRKDIFKEIQLYEEIQIEREFLGYFAPEGDKPSIPRKDCARIGYCSWFNIQYKTIYINPPKDFPQLYVDTALSETMFNRLCNKYPFDDWEICQWLNHMSILEKTKEIYEKQVSGVVKELQKERIDRQKTEEKLKSIIDSLTPEERKKLKSLL